MEEGARSSNEDTGPLFADFNRANLLYHRGQLPLPTAPAVAIASSPHQNNRRRRAIVPGTGNGNEAYDLHQVLYDTGKTPGRPKNLLTSVFNCMCRSKVTAVDSRHVNSALLHQTRLHHEALIETQETRDMWEWQMEQQQLLTSQEHDLVEKQCPMGIWPLEQQLARNSSSSRSSGASILCRNAGIVQGGKDEEEDGDFEKEEIQLADLMIEQDVSHSSKRLFQQQKRRSTDRDKEASSSVTPQIMSNPYIHPAPLLLLFESTLLRCRSEMNTFCRIYMQQMVLSGFTIIKTLTELEPSTVFLHKVHCSYALESRVCSVLFRCFENDSFDDTGLMQILDQDARTAARLQDYFRMKAIDPEEALAIQNPSYDPAFHQFCVNKSEEIASMFNWSMAYRNATERDKFMEAFLRVAKWVWMLHRLANAVHPPMQIIRVGKGMELHPLYVEAVSPPLTINCPKCPVPKVEFMVMPGFIASRKVLKAKVYQHYMCKSGQ